MATTKKDRATELIDMVIPRVDGVDRPATGREFLILKNEGDIDELRVLAHTLAVKAGAALAAVLGEKPSLSEETQKALNELADVLDYPERYVPAKPGDRANDGDDPDSEDSEDEMQEDGQGGKHPGAKRAMENKGLELLKQAITLAATPSPESQAKLTEVLQGALDAFTKAKKPMPDDPADGMDGEEKMPHDEMHEDGQGGKHPGKKSACAKCVEVEITSALVAAFGGQSPDALKALTENEALMRDAITRGLSMARESSAA